MYKKAEIFTLEKALLRVGSYECPKKYCALAYSGCPFLYSG